MRLRLGGKHVLVGDPRLGRVPQCEQRVGFRLADVRRDRPSFLTQRGDFVDDVLPPLAIPQRHHAVAAQPDEEPVVGRRGCPGLGEQRLEACERRVGPVEAMRGIQRGNRRGLVDERCRLARLDSRIASRGVKARGERRAELDEDAAHFATQALVVGREQPGREIRAERRVWVPGFEGGACFSESCGERPLGALGESSAALGREPGGVRPPLLVAVGARHRAEHVLGRLGGARALEDVRGLAGPPGPLEHDRQVEPYAGVGGRRLRERLERRDGRVVLAAPRRLDRGLARLGRGDANAADEQARRHDAHERARVHVHNSRRF